MVMKVAWSLQATDYLLLFSLINFAHAHMNVHTRIHTYLNAINFIYIFLHILYIM